MSKGYGILTAGSTITGGVIGSMFGGQEIEDQGLDGKDAAGLMLHKILKGSVAGLVVGGGLSTAHYVGKLAGSIAKTKVGIKK